MTLEPEYKEGYLSFQIKYTNIIQPVLSIKAAEYDHLVLPEFSGMTVSLLGQRAARLPLRADIRL